MIELAELKNDLEKGGKKRIKEVMKKPNKIKGAYRATFSAMLNDAYATQTQREMFAIREQQMQRGTMGRDMFRAQRQPITATEMMLLRQTGGA